VTLADLEISNDGTPIPVAVTEKQDKI
jgi:hypothetical protein